MQATDERLDFGFGHQRHVSFGDALIAEEGFVYPVFLIHEGVADAVDVRTASGYFLQGVVDGGEGEVDDFIIVRAGYECGLERGRCQVDATTEQGVKEAPVSVGVGTLNILVRPRQARR